MSEANEVPILVVNKFAKWIISSLYCQNAIHVVLKFIFLLIS